MAQRHGTGPQAPGFGVREQYARHDLGHATQQRLHAQRRRLNTVVRAQRQQSASAGNGLRHRHRLGQRPPLPRGRPQLPLVRGQRLRPRAHELRPPRHARNQRIRQSQRAQPLPPRDGRFQRLPAPLRRKAHCHFGRKLRQTHHRRPHVRRLLPLPARDELHRRPSRHTRP